MLKSHEPGPGWCWELQGHSRTMVSLAKICQRYSAGSQKIICYCDSKEVKWEFIFCISKHLCLGFEEAFFCMFNRECKTNFINCLNGLAIFIMV